MGLMPSGLLAEFGLTERDMPDCWQTRSGRLLICGGGRCVWDDLERLGCAGRRGTFEWVSYPGDVMCVNDIGMHYPGKFQHWYSNDCRMLKYWLQSRRPNYKKSVDERIVTHSCNPGACYHWKVPGTGSSGLNAVYVGLGLGYDSIVLAGIPLDDSGHYFDAPWVKTNFNREVPERYWLRARDRIFKGKVKSMSGRTAEWLGTI